MMTAMPYTPGRFRAVVGVGWVVLAVAAVLYAQMKGIPAMVALPAAAAFLIEFPFYLLPGFQPARLRNPILLAATFLLPYLVSTLPSGKCPLPALPLLTRIALVISFWFRVLPKGPLTDVL